MFRNQLFVVLVVSACRAPELRHTAQPAQTTTPTAVGAGAPATPGAATGCVDDSGEQVQRRPNRERPFVEWIPDEDVPLTRTKPNEQVRVGSVVCKAKSDVWRDAEGRVRVCTVAHRTKLFGIEIAADAYTHFHEDGRPYQTHIAVSQVLATAAGERVHCAPDLVVIAKGGALVHCQLESSTIIGKVACRGGESVAFHPQGELAAAVIDREMQFSGVSLPAGTRLFFFPSGAPAGGWVREPLRIGEYLIAYDFSFHENGKLRAFQLAEPRVIQGQSLPERAKLELRKDGTLKYAEYQTDHGFMPHGELWHDTKHVRFDCEGKVTSEFTEHWQAPFPPHPPKR